jgi:Ca2+-binding EF-hand superfamily protein
MSKTTKHDITPQYREELQEAFSMFDKDNSGTISVDELATILKNLNQNYHDDGM